MVTEQSVKAILLLKKISFRRVHDVSDVLLQLQHELDLPKWFRDQIPSLVNSLIELTEQRALASYGFEEDLDENYFKEYAPEAFALAKKALTNCRRLLKEQTES